MVQDIIDELKAKLHEALFIDLGEFGLEAQQQEITSRFIGIHLRSAFQPIVRGGNGAPIGYEALLRTSIGEPLTPQFAFEFADRQGQLVKLDRIARTLHVLNYRYLPENPGLLFLNVHPKLLTSVNAHGKVFERVLHAHSVPTNQVVVEIQESAVEVDGLLNQAIDNYRDRGYRIALDGFWGRRTNLERLWKLPVDFVKLDQSLIREAEASAKARKVLAKLVEIILAVGAQPVIQGIGTADQLQIALETGASLLQGYHLGRPASSTEWLAGQPPPIAVAP